MLPSITENSSSVKTYMEPSSSSSPPAVSHSLFLKNIPSLSECQPSETFRKISGPIPKSEVASFLVRTFADLDDKITHQAARDMQRFTMQDIQHLQSLFAKYILTDSITWYDLLAFDMYILLKEISSFFPQEQGDAFMKKWTCSYLSGCITLSLIEIKDIRKGNFHFDTLQDYQRKLNELSQEMKIGLESAQSIGHSPIRIPESIITKNAKRKYIAMQQKVKEEQQEQRKRNALDLINQWDITAQLVIKFLGCSDPYVVLGGKTIQDHPNANQLTPTNPEQCLTALRNLRSYMQMHIDCFTALIAQYPQMLLSVPPFSRELLPLIEVMLETLDVEQTDEHCRHILEIIKSIKKEINEQLIGGKAEYHQASSGVLTYSRWCKRHGLSSQIKMDQTSLTSQLLHRHYYNGYMLALCADYQNVIELVRSCLKTEFNSSLSNYCRIAHVIQHSVSSKASSSSVMMRPLIKLMRKIDETLLKKTPPEMVNQYSLAEMNLNENYQQLYKELKCLVNSTFNQFIAENRATRLLLDEDQELPEEVANLCRAFTLLHDLGIVLEKEELRNSSDLDILPDAFFDLFTLADQGKDPITPSEPKLVVDTPVSLSPKSLIVEATQDSSSPLTMPIDSKGDMQSLETIDEILSNDSSLLSIDTVQEEAAKKLSGASTHPDTDAEILPMTGSSYWPSSSLPTVKHHSKKRSVPRPQPVPAEPVVTARVQASVSISESQAEALEDILHTHKRTKIEKILARLGLKPIPCKGGHTKWKDPSGTFGQTVTSGKDVPIGTRGAIVEQLKIPSSHGRPLPS